MFDPAALVSAWEAHDRFCFSLAPQPGERKKKHLPYNGGVDVTNRLLEEQRKAAETLGVSVEAFVATVTAERLKDPGPDIAGAIERVLATGFDFTIETCKNCKRDIPSYDVYVEYHKEHCPEIGPQR